MIATGAQAIAPELVIFDCDGVLVDSDRDGVLVDSDRISLRVTSPPAAAAPDLFLHAATRMFTPPATVSASLASAQTFESMAELPGLLGFK